jgi:cobalt/nickel transport system permease protein
MHLPDGYLSDPVCFAATVASAASLAGCVMGLRRSQQPLRTQTIAVIAAGIFAAQMVNFPIATGTSGHVIGAALAAILCGPWAAALCMTVVIALQALLFADGGVMALGANVLNMGVIAPLVAAIVYRAALSRSASPSAYGNLLAAFVASFASVVAAALACTIELALSGTQQASVVLVPMLSVHALIGIAEGLITVAALAAIARTVRAFPQTKNHPAIAGFAVAVLGVMLLAPIASSAPDGLERVAGDFGISNFASSNWTGVAADYAMPGISWEFLAIALAGLLGIVAVFVSMTIVSRAALVRVPKQQRRAEVIR